LLRCRGSHVFLDNRLTVGGEVVSLEPATFGLVAYCLNQLRYCVPQLQRVNKNSKETRTEYKSYLYIYSFFVVVKLRCFYIVTC
jgi:hypothetical protein